MEKKMINDNTTARQAGLTDAESIARNAVEEFKAALYRVPGFGNRVNKEVREKLTEAHCIMLNLPALLDQAAHSAGASNGKGVTDDVLLSAFNSADSVIDGLHEILRIAAHVAPVPTMPQLVSCSVFDDMLRSLEHVESVYRLNVVKVGEPSSTLDNLQRVIARAKATSAPAAQADGG